MMVMKPEDLFNQFIFKKKSVLPLWKEDEKEEVIVEKEEEKPEENEEPEDQEVKEMNDLQEVDFDLQ
jgi:hypothetical protein